MHKKLHCTVPLKKYMFGYAMGVKKTHEKVSMKINYNENVLLLEICKNYVQCTFLELLNLNFTLFLNPFF